MPSFLRNLLIVFVLGAGLLLPVGVAQAASDGCKDDDPGTVCDILDKPCAANPDAPGCQDRDQTPTSNSLYGPNGILTKATRLVSILVGVASVIAIIIGGFKYVLSNGDAAGVNSAKNTILYAVIGLVIALVAQAIVLLVVNSL